MSVHLAAWFLLLTALATAQTEPRSTRGETTDPSVVALRDRIASDSAVSDTVAARVARSQLSQFLTPLSDQDTREAAAKRWAAEDPDSAARVMIGLMSDDAAGTKSYESTLVHQLQVSYVHNPGAEKNLFNRLRRTARDSKLLKKQANEVSDDERREILRAIFEGKGTQANTKLRDKPDETPTAEKSSPPATSFNGIYDRLSAGNLNGYSPQLLALQSALNQRRAPGAPLLVETGKLDYQTLAYPAYGMQFDLKNLDDRIRRDRVAALAREAGVTPSAKDWDDPEFEARLLRGLPNRPPPPRLKSRAELTDKARAAMTVFSAAAEKAKQPGGLTRNLLIELGGLQRETARWIAAAALEEELNRLEEFEGFLTPELRAAISEVPTPQTTRDAYLVRGRDLQNRANTLKLNAQKALDHLQSKDWSAQLAAVDALVAQNRQMKKNLSPDIGAYVRTPFEIREANFRRTRLREIIDDFAVKWAPRLAYSRAVAARRGALTRLLGVFTTIASGEFTGTRTDRITP